MNSKLRAIVFPIPSDTQSARRRFSVEVLYRQHGASLVDFVAHRVRDEDAAEDIVQETFASILDGRAFRSPRSTSSPSCRLSRATTRPSTSSSKLGGMADALPGKRGRALAIAPRSRAVGAEVEGATTRTSARDVSSAPRDRANQLRAVVGRRRPSGSTRGRAATLPQSPYARPSRRPCSSRTAPANARHRDRPRAPRESVEPPRAGPRSRSLEAPA